MKQTNQIPREEINEFVTMINNLNNEQLDDLLRYALELLEKEQNIID